MRSILIVLLAALGAALTGSPAGAQEEAPQEGPPRVVRILVEGHRRYREEELRAALGQPVGAPLDEAAVNRGLKRLWELYHVRATTRYRRVEGGVDLLLQVVEIPVDLEPRFLGNVDVDVEELLEWAGLEEGQEVFFNEAQRVARRIQEGYLRKGYYFSDVQVVTREPGVEDGQEVAPDIIFRIREGPKVKVRDIVIEGNESMPEEGFLLWKSGLRKFASLELRGPILWVFTKPFRESVLQADLLAMRDVYRDRGFLDAVVELDRLEFSDDREWVTVVVRVDEGPRWRVGSLSIDAFELRLETPDARSARIEPAQLLFPEDELLGEVELEAGSYFEERKIREDERALRAHYGERGYLSHPSIPFGQKWDFLDPDLLFDFPAKEVHVTYRIVQGRKQFIREVLFSGASHTQDRVLRRLVTVSPGRQADLNEIESSLARVRRTGYFLDPLNPSLHLEPTYRFLETDDPAWKDLLFEVEEGAPLNLQFGGGVSSNQGLFGNIYLRVRNFDIGSWPSSLGSAFGEIADKEAFHGAGQELELFAQPGTEDSRFRVSFFEPDVFRLHQGRIGMRLDAERTLRIYRSHDERRSELGLRLTRQVGTDGLLFAGYTLADVEVDDLDEGGEPIIGQPLTVPQLLQDQLGERDVSHFELGWRHNTLDHPLDPRSGRSYYVRTRLYDDELGSDFSFVKAELSAEFLQPLGDETLDVRPTMRYSLGLGSAFGYADTDDVPYTERYFLGGSSLRGFRLRGVGPNENALPIGGETYLSASVDYRFPLFTTTDPGTYREREAIRGFVFADAGVLDPDSFDLDLSELRASAGFGVGLSLGPIPLVLTFGFPIEEGPGDREQVFSFRLGFF